MMENSFYLREFVHYFLHLIFPGMLAWIFWKNKWKKTWLILLATMFVDLDHIFADPLFDPKRNSINFHPLHTYPAIAVYLLGAIFLRGNWQIASVGLVLHMLTDFQDYHLWR